MAKILILNKLETSLFIVSISLLLQISTGCLDIPPINILIIIYSTENETI